MFLKRPKSNGKLPAIPEGCNLGSLTTTEGNSVPYGTGESSCYRLYYPNYTVLQANLCSEIGQYNADRLKKEHRNEVIGCDTFEANRY
ncbi:hypothetical protein C8N47_1199 [Mangrovibacterium marinum]|uniref:Uncharacterized protein n=1 Tax=Mangrovibacterium marinum TaxID=1639118 RepID=A0A2T5BYH1_9BACT|nr:hypothetical protein C8N47_1199 [Mangrovibacterium marinum]